jgi:mannosyltransferase OCH1-like enzyme
MIFLYFYHFYEYINLRILNQKVKLRYIKRIPNYIFKSYREKVSYSFFKNNKVWKENNKDFNIIWFNDDEIDEFMNNYFIKDDKNLSLRIKKAYNKLKPKAYRVDLWRLCILYKFGGIYSDAFCYPYIRMKDIIENIKEKSDSCNLISVLDCGVAGNGIHNGFIIAKRKNKYLLECIKDIVKNIENNYYGESSLSITGPLALKKTFERLKGKFKKGFNYGNSVYLFKHYYGIYQNIYDRNSKIISKYYSFIFYLIRKTFSNGYNKDWKNKKIYLNCEK